MKFFFTTMIAAVFPASSLLAQTVTLSPVTDVFVSSANAASNYGGAGALAVSASGLAKGEFDSLLRFDLASAKTSFDALYGAGAWTLQSLTLTLTAQSPANAIFNGNGAGPGGTNVNLAGQIGVRWIANDSWVEGTGTPNAPTTNGITFNGLGALLGGANESLGTFAFGGETAGASNYSLALTPSFTADAAAGQMVSLVVQPADAGVSDLVNSRSVGTASLRPVLTVTAVPEPCGVALALSGLLVLAARRGGRFS